MYRAFLVIPLVVLIYLVGVCLLPAQTGPGYSGPPLMRGGAGRFAPPIVELSSDNTPILRRPSDPGPPRLKAAPEVRYSPFNAVQIATVDAVGVAALNDPFLRVDRCRYISLHNFSKKKRAEVKRVIDFVVNSLNTKFRQIIRTATLPADSHDPIVIRVYLDDYGIDVADWDNLLDNGSGPRGIPEPYFHILVEKVDLKQAAKKPVQKVARKVKKQVERTHYEEKLKWKKTGNWVWNYQQNCWEHEWVKEKVKVPVKKMETIYETIYEVPKDTAKKGEVKKSGELITQRAPWLFLEQNLNQRGHTIKTLEELTQTKNPICRADWFATYATWAPAYYKLIGLERDKNGNFLERDFEKLMRFDLGLSGDDIVAAIADTKLVTLHNRIIQRFTTTAGLTGGMYWRSKDTANGLEAQDYLENIVDFKNPKIVAQEIIASGRNGLNFYCVTDDKGKILNLAEAAVAQIGDEMPTKLRDKQVHVARNCMLCHSNGMIYIQDHVRNLAQRDIALFIRGHLKDPKRGNQINRSIQEAFSPDIQPVIDHDNARFNASVKAASGYSGKQLGAKFENLLYTYYDTSVTLEDMAREAGLSNELLLAYLKRGVNLHYTATSVLQEPPVFVSRIAWENRGFGSMMLYLLRAGALHQGG